MFILGVVFTRTAVTPPLTLLMKMDPSAVRVLQALLVFLTLSHAAASSPCPRPCACPQRTEVHCTFRSLFTIPAALPKHVKRMNLGSVLLLYHILHTNRDNTPPPVPRHGGLYVMMPPTLLVHVFRFNSINKITDKSLAGLRKLELLLVHGNDIHSLLDGAFRDLSSLQVGEAHHKKMSSG